MSASGALAASPNLVISQVYGGGGNTGATFKNDFIELYNTGATPVSVSGWSVQYASSAGTTWQRTLLSGTIAPGRYYLVQEAAGTGGTTALPAPDATGTIPMSATAGKVVLVNNTTILTGTSCPSVVLGVVDLVGFGAANCFEGAGPTGAPSNTSAAIRNGAGSIDTDSNNLDFTVGAPVPRNGGESAPSVTATSPTAGATDVSRSANITITFSEPVLTSGSWYSISCATSGGHTAAASGGPTAFTLDPDTNFAASESCTVTIRAANVTDTDSLDPPDAMAADYVFTFTTETGFACGDPAAKIHDVQGSGAATPVAASTVAVEGVVVGDYQQIGGFAGYYLQEEVTDADADPLTSEGIFVSSTTAVNVGDVVRVRGTANESSGLTRISSVTATLVCASGATVPATSASLPVANVADFEPLEGMLVRFAQTLTATEVYSLGRYGEISLATDRLFVGTAVALPGSGANAITEQNKRSRIILDDGDNTQNRDPVLNPQGGLSASNTLRVGDKLPALDGVLDFRFGNYRVQPVGLLAWDHANARTPAPDPVGGNLKVASFNVLNYFNGNGTGLDGAAGGYPTSRGANTLFEFNRQRAKEISALSAMNADIVGLMEMENDAPPRSAVEDLVAGLNDAMGAGTYAFVDTGVIGGDEIKVALIYKPAAVTPVGTYKTITSAIDPRFIDTRNRPSLAQTFAHNATGEKLTVVVSHLKSKGSACTGDPDTGEGAGNCNVTRREAAAAISDWLAGDPTASGDPDFLLIGDMNSYTFEEPIRMFESKGFTNLVRRYHGLDAYSYVFNGESGYLDHALASPSLTDQATGVSDWHLNPDEPTVLDYNTEFKSSGQLTSFYSPGPYRSSDHDPVVIGFHFNSAPTVDAGGPYTVAEGGSVAVSATGDDVDGGPLTYAWDLDDDGAFETAGQTVTFSAATIDGPSTRTIKVRITDDHGAATVDAATVEVTNVAPTSEAGGPYTVAEGGSVTVAATGTDVAADTLTYAWDLDSDGTFETTGQSASFSAALLDGPLTKTVAVKVTDDDGASTTDTATVTITNVAPTATFNAPASASAGFPFTLSLTSPQDPAPADTFAYAFDCGDGMGYGAFGPSNTAVCSTSAPGTRSVGGKIRDDDGGVTEYRGTVDVTVTFNSLCALVRAYSSDDRLAVKLCRDLDKAAIEQAKDKRHSHLEQFAKEVDKNKHGAFTEVEAATLQALAGALG